jgi:hypothetical protein
VFHKDWCGREKRPEKYLKKKFNQPLPEISKYLSVVLKA